MSTTENVSNFDRFYAPLYKWCGNNVQHRLGADANFNILWLKELSNIDGFADYGVRTVYARAVNDPTAITYNMHTSCRVIKIVIAFGLEFRKDDTRLSVCIADEYTYTKEKGAHE